MTPYNYIWMIYDHENTRNLKINLFYFVWNQNNITKMDHIFVYVLLNPINSYKAKNSTTILPRDVIAYV